VSRVGLETAMPVFSEGQHRAFFRVYCDLLLIFLLLCSGVIGVTIIVGALVYSIVVKFLSKISETYP
jgi:hypothetical protein